MHVLLVGPEFEENLSLRYLAAALQEAGHSASLARFDSAEYVESVVQRAVSEQPGIVGLSMVFQVRAREFMELARALRRAGYGGHITAGGHFATFACEPLLRDLPELDSIIRQEGEQTLVELADALEPSTWPSPPSPLCQEQERGSRDVTPPQFLGEGPGVGASPSPVLGGRGRGLGVIPGIVTRGADGGVVLAERRQQAADLDVLPFPIREAEPERHLGVKTAFLVGSRGCYADCDYCSIFAWHEAAVGKRYRLRSPANIAQEMAGLYHERGVRFFVFHDDNFFLPSAAANHRRFEALKAELDRHGLRNIGLMLKLRPNDCDRENMLLLREMGLLRAFVGIENASGRQLRSLGRDSTVGDIEACLGMLRELDVYATFNLLLFDPYTTLDDVAQNLRFMRANLHFPFNWCKVEPYAGTALEKRYAAERRLRGDYLGCDYVMDDPRVRLLYDLLLPAVHYRNYDYFGLSNLNIGLGYHRQLLKRFYPERSKEDLCDRTQRLIERINGDAVDLLERAWRFAGVVSLGDRAAISRMREELKRACFTSQHALSEEAEALLQEIERAAGLRQELTTKTQRTRGFTKSLSATLWPLSLRVHREGRTRRAGVAEAFTPLVRPSEETRRQSGRRGVLAMLAGAAVWVLTGCRRRGAGNASPIPGRAAGGEGERVGGPPAGSVNVAPGKAEIVAAGEPMVLEARLEPADAKVIGEPRITARSGTVQHVRASSDRRVLTIDFLPGSVSREWDPNATISVAWTVRGEKSDTVVVTRGFVHIRADDTFAFGYETPRPTIAEMAAPPIMRTPNPRP